MDKEFETATDYRSKVDLTTGDTFWNFSSCRRMMSWNINLVVYVTNTSDSMQWSEIIILNICTVSKYVIKSPWIWLWKGGSGLFFSRSKCFIVLKLPPSSWWLTSQGKMFWNGCSKKKESEMETYKCNKTQRGSVSDQLRLNPSCPQQLITRSLITWLVRF